MTAPYVEACLLILPAVIGGAVHMAVVRLNLFRQLTVPINQALFGANKTWRGFVVMPLACTLGVMITALLERGLDRHSVFGHTNLILVGVMLGLAYCLGELPNSYMKRRLGIPPGQSLPGYRFLTLLCDHLDSLVGCLFVYVLVLGTGPAAALWILVLGPLVHIVVNLMLYAAGLRREAF